MYKEFQDAVDAAKRIVVIQAENPDGDSLGSALALEDILGNLGKDVELYCPVGLPKYLRYVDGWDRVTDELSQKADLVIIVDTLSDTLLSKVLEVPGARHFLETHPVFALDHHVSVESSLSFPHTTIASDTAVATGELICDMARELGWKLSKVAGDCLYVAIMSDSLGLTTPATTAASYRAVADLLDAGTIPADLEAKRRELMKKAPEILAYKGKLIERIEYHLDGKLALVHIPWDEIQAYSDQYNPSMLVLDEMRLVDDVEVAVAIKSYPDGKVTGKLRSNLPVSDAIAGYFGGGGHPYAAGFRAYEDYATIERELIQACDKVLMERAA